MGVRRWLTVILSTLAGTAVVVALVVGVDAAWQWAPGSTPVAAVAGDQRIDLETQLPPTPTDVAVYEVTGPLTRAQLRRVLPGRVTSSDGWLTWWGHSDVPVADVLAQLHPGVRWQVRDGAFGPVAKGVAAGIRTGGMSPAFTGTDAYSNSFGRYLVEEGELFFFNIPAVRIAEVRTVEVISAEDALEKLRHHDPAARVLPTDVVPLPSRLAGQHGEPLPPITDVRLVHAQQPADVRRSTPVWVFDPIGEVDARR